MPLALRRTLDSPKTKDAAEHLQHQLALEVQTGQKFNLVGSVQVRYQEQEKRAITTALTLSASNWHVVEKQVVEGVPPIGRWPGCEAFRDGPLMVEALQRLRHVPDVIFVRGSGRAQMRKFGTACYVGLALEVPTIGVDLFWPDGCIRAGALLNRGAHKRGFRSGLIHEATKELVGYELRTQDRQDPLYVSPGHRIDLDACVTMVLMGSKFFRVPEPLRQGE